MKSIQKDRIKSLSYCMVSDIFEEDGPPTDYFHGGFGLLNLQGLRKPSYFAYKFFNELGDTALKCTDSNAFACTSHQNVQILFWDCTVRQNKENRIYYREDHPAKSAGTAYITISGLKPGKYLQSIYRVGYKSNDVYTFYCNLNSKDNLTHTQIQVLDELSCGYPEYRQIIDITSTGQYSYQFPIRENDVCFITLEYL